MGLGPCPNSSFSPPSSFSRRNLTSSPSSFSSPSSYSSSVVSFFFREPNPNLSPISMAKKEAKRMTKNRKRAGEGGGTVPRRPNALSTAPGGSQSKKVTNRRPTGLPLQYDFTPTNPARSTAAGSQEIPVPGINHQQTPTVRDYPPPANLFQTAASYPGASPMGAAPRSRPPPQPVASPSIWPSVSQQPRASGSHHSSQAQNSLEEEDEDEDEEADSDEGDSEEEIQREPNLPEDTLAALHNLLLQPGRELYTTVLSPKLEPGTTWFVGKEKSKLTRKITKVFTNKFDEPFYSWGCVPIRKRQSYFLEFAKTHTWHPNYTGTVQAKFYAVCQIRMKDMVSKALGRGKKPSWIEKKLWKVMVEYWNSDEAKTKSSTTSAARNSDRNGLGPHKHASGSKSYEQVREEMEVELGRPPTFYEVFIRVHTKKDGTLVDNKAQAVHEAYKKKKEAKLAALANDESADGTSPRSELCEEEDNDLFLQSTFISDRGDYFGVGSLGKYINEKRKYTGIPSPFIRMEEKLEVANSKIEQQAALQAEREAELMRVAAEQQAEINLLKKVKKYLSKTDPNFQAFLDSESEDH